MSEQVVLNSLCVGKIDVLSTSADGDIDYFDISSVDNANKRIIAHQTMRAKDAPSRAKQLVRTDDILVSTVRPNLNAVAMVNSNTGNTMVASTGFCVLRANARADPHYLFHFVQSSRFVEAMVSQATGASYPAVSNSIVKNCSIPLRDLPTQRRIATTLDKVSEGIDLCRKMLGDLDKLVKSQFVEMFGTVHNNVFQFAEGTLESISYGFFAGGDKPSDCTTERDEAHPYPVFANGYENEGLQGYSAKCRVTQPAVTVSARGTIGYCYIREAGFTPVVRLITIVPNNKVSPVFLKYAIDTMDIKSSGTSQAQLTVPDFKRERIIVPPADLQGQFAAFVSQADKSKFVVQQQMAELETLKKSLMQKYFG